jgi:hypothetical protein
MSTEERTEELTTFTEQSPSDSLQLPTIFRNPKVYPAANRSRPVVPILR